MTGREVVMACLRHCPIIAQSIKWLLAGFDLRQWNEFSSSPPRPEQLWDPSNLIFKDYGGSIADDEVATTWRSTPHLKLVVRFTPTLSYFLMLQGLRCRQIFSLYNICLEELRKTIKFISGYPVFGLRFETRPPKYEAGVPTIQK
jgi:hypothetical protein